MRAPPAPPGPTGVWTDKHPPKGLLRLQMGTTDMTPAYRQPRRGEMLGVLAIAGAQVLSQWPKERKSEEEDKQTGRKVRAMPALSQTIGPVLVPGLRRAGRAWACQACRAGPSSAGTQNPTEDVSHR